MGTGKGVKFGERLFTFHKSRICPELHRSDVAANINSDNIRGNAGSSFIDFLGEAHHAAFADMTIRHNDNFGIF